MGRRVLIVAELDEAARELAQAEGIGEIVVGIPASLAESLAGVTLPYVYVEPEQAVDPLAALRLLALADVLALLSDAGWLALTTDGKLEALRQAIGWHVTFNVDTTGIQGAGDE